MNATPTPAPSPLRTCSVCHQREDGHGLIWCENRYTLDGEPVDIQEFCDDNGFGPPDWDRIGSLKVGEEITYGGGAAATFVLRREA